MRNIFLCFLVLSFGGFSSASLEAATFHVQIRDYFFTPTNVSIAIGDTVQWTNTTSMQHDATSTNAAKLWNSATLNGGATFAVTFPNAGTFPYFCSRHFFAFMNPHREQTGTVTVASANLPPEVTIITPTNNARFLAPGNFTLQANATDAGGSVTNVEFFSGNTSLGNVTLAPHMVGVNNLPAGNYTLTARAHDNGGVIATSAPVNISILTNAVLKASERLSDGRFRLSIEAVPDQTYTVESSTNLLNWSALATNVAPANAFNFTDSTATGVLQKFYRARQDLR